MLSRPSIKSDSRMGRRIHRRRRIDNEHSLALQAFDPGRILDQKTPRMTQRYAHLSPGFMAAAVGKLDGIMGGMLPASVPAGPLAEKRSPTKERDCRDHEDQAGIATQRPSAEPTVLPGNSLGSGLANALAYRAQSWLRMQGSNQLLLLVRQQLLPLLQAAQQFTRRSLST